MRGLERLNVRARQVAAWVGVAVAGVSLGLGVAWVEKAFAIPKNVVLGFWIVVMVVVLGFALWVGRGYYLALRDEDEWE